LGLEVDQEKSKIEDLMAARNIFSKRVRFLSFLEDMKIMFFRGLKLYKIG
jgi:hypothetical protein